MPPDPVRESTAPRAMVLPALFPALGVALPVVVLLLQAERRRVQTTSSGAALRPNFQSTLPPITAYGTDSGARKSTQIPRVVPRGCRFRQKGSPAHFLTESGPARNSRSSGGGRRACRAGSPRGAGRGAGAASDC